MASELEWPNWPGFSTRAVVDLETYGWPGNVRELRNVVERAVYRAEDPERQIDSIQFDPFHSPWAPADSPSAAPAPVSEGVGEPAPTPAVPPASTGDLRGAVNAYERALLEDALAKSRFNQRATAAALGLSYDQLRHALKRHKLLDGEAAA
jgi:psp operon transcriptional activator